MLGGWLHRRTCHVAANVLRGERRRQHREREAAQMNELQGPTDQNHEQLASVLDEGINLLNASDRAAIVLRYFEGRDLRSVGAALGTNDDAAQKRVGRALEKLRVLLARRGLTASVAVLASVLSAQPATVAPLALAASVSTVALANASATSATALGLLKITAMAKAKLAFGVVVAASLGTLLVVEYKAWTTARHEHELLKQQVKNFHNEPATGLLPPGAFALPSKADPLSGDQLAELERLRSEISGARQKTSELARLRQENERLQAAFGGGKPGDPDEIAFEQETRHRLHSMKTWGLLFRVYAFDHGGQFPDTWDKVAQEIPALERAAFLKFANDNFEITYRGNEETISSRFSTILFREKQARLSPTGKRIKVYGHTDGSASTVSEPGLNFEAFEKKNIIVPNNRGDSPGL
jgi:hypothetical protein